MVDWPAIDATIDFDVTIDRDAEVPLGVQLGWALCARIGDGRIKPGQRLPALRDMAEGSGLNVNTVRAVYQRLEQRGLVESHQGSGTFVTRSTQLPSLASAIAADAAREAMATGVDPREVAAALYVEPNSIPAPPAAARGVEREAEEPAARRRSLRSQIATLERAISEIEADHPGVAPPPVATRRGPGPTLLTAEELEEVRSALVHRLAAVQAAIDEWNAASREHSERDATARAGARNTRSARERARGKRAAEEETPPRQPAKRKRAAPTGRPAPAGT